jgi:Domain of unknown function (DUF4440)
MRTTFIRMTVIRVTGLWFVLLCAMSPSVPGQNATDAGTAAAIRSLEHAWVVGQSHNSNHALDLIFDDDLVYIEYGRLMTKGEYLSRIKRETLQPDQIVMEPMTVRTFGRSTAIVVGTYREKGMKSTSARLKRWRFVDTWVYKKSGWMLVAAAAAPLPG